MKICGHCHSKQPLDNFSRDSSAKDGLKGTCKGCLSSAYKIYHDAHPEKVTARMRKWRQIPGNKEKACDVVKRIYWENPEDGRRKSNERKKTDLGKIRVARYNSARRSRVISQENTLTLEEVNLLLGFQGGVCARCRMEFSSSFPYTLDHMLPVSKGGGLTLNNVQLLCTSCNSSKSNKHIVYRDLLPSELAVDGG